MKQKTNITQIKLKYLSEELSKRYQPHLIASEMALFQKIVKERDEVFPGRPGLYNIIADEVEAVEGVRPTYTRVAYTMTGRKIYQNVVDAFFRISKKEREKAAAYSEDLQPA